MGHRVLLCQPCSPPGTAPPCIRRTFVLVVARACHWLLPFRTSATRGYAPTPQAFAPLFPPPFQAQPACAMAGSHTQYSLDDMTQLAAEHNIILSESEHTNDLEWGKILTLDRGKKTDPIPSKTRTADTYSRIIIFTTADKQTSRWKTTTLEPRCPPEHITRISKIHETDQDTGTRKIQNHDPSPNPNKNHSPT